MSAEPVIAPPRRGAIPMMALACGVTVANIYMCQPLLGEFAREFGVPDKQAGLVAFGTQVGYGLGILLLTPLADRTQPAKLVRWLTALTAAGLLAAAFAPNVHALALASLVFSITTIVPQVLISLAPSMAGLEQRGRMVGALMTGLIGGILLSRTAAGVIAQAAGTWRASYVAAAVLTGALFFVLPGFLPRRTPHDRLSYGALLASLPGLLRHGRLRTSMGVNFFSFAAFSAIWANLAFHLGAPPFDLGPAQIGLFGVWGAAGALLAPYAGRLADRWGPDRVNMIGLAAVALSVVLSATLGASALLGMVLALNLLDFGQQSGQIANQTRIFGIDPAVRGRLNTLYMTAAFTGGALGSLGGALAWDRAGWVGVCAAAGVFVLCSAVVLAFGAQKRPG